MEQKTKYTKEGFAKLQEEYEYLKNVRRQEVKEQLKVARSFGDLSENSEYDEAKNDQARMEARIARLEEQLKNVIIAYEPVWAIGTGLTATPEQAQETCAVIRKVVAGLYGDEVAEGLTIQYGGSMNDANAAELLAKPDVDGGLIGGASLVAKKFAAIVDAAQ